jgi:hypothetical protein
MCDAAKRLNAPIKSWQTRVLRLHPGLPGHVLQADLLPAGLPHEYGLVISMDEEPIEYEAISYTWGEPSPCINIVVNAMEYRITRSLGAALRRFRYPDQTRYLWADAVCINQSDNEEKSVQVSNMFTIFHKSKRTLVWLGQVGLSDAVLEAGERFLQSLVIIENESMLKLEESQRPGGSKRSYSNDSGGSEISASDDFGVSEKSLGHDSEVHEKSYSNDFGGSAFATSDDSGISENSLSHDSRVSENSFNRGFASLGNELLQRVGESKLHSFLAGLCSSQWIRRVWIQQEVYASRDLTSFFGRTIELSLQQLKACARLLLDAKKVGWHTEEHLSAHAPSAASSDMSDHASHQTQGWECRSAAFPASKPGP